MNSASFENDKVTEFPNIFKVEFDRINKKYLRVIIISYILFFIPFLVGLYFLHKYVVDHELENYLTLIDTGFFIVFGYIFLHQYLAFPKRKYLVRDKDISYKSGLFIKTITTVPFSRIQHIEIDEKPISRFFKLASISVYTAGDSSDDLEIKGLNKQKAQQIKEFISQKINE